jgi:Skp family chaperone for outer membrane proteins
MNLVKKTFFIFIFLFLTINLLKAEDKVSYVDIDYVLANTKAGKELLFTLKREEEMKIIKFKSNDENFKNEEKKILAKKNLISKEELNKEMKNLKVKFQRYKKEKIKEINDLKSKRNKNIVNFLDLINPIIEKYMFDNSIHILLDKKNIFIANKNYDVTNKLIEIIDNQIKTVEIK